MNTLLRFLFVMIVFYVGFQCVIWLVKRWMKNKIEQLKNRAAQNQNFEQQDGTYVNQSNVKPSVSKPKPDTKDYIDFEEIK